MTYTLRTAWLTLPGLTAEECETKTAELLVDDPDLCVWMEPEQ